MPYPRNRHKRAYGQSARWLPVLLCALLVACSPPGPPQRDLLKSIRDAGQLTIITRVNPSTYYTDHGRPEGFEYELAAEFARELGVTLNVETAPNISQVLAMLNSGHGDIAAAGLVVTPQHSGNYAFSPSYMAIRQQVIYRDGTPPPRRIEDLAGTPLLVVANSGREDWLLALHKLHPELQWQTDEDIDTQGLLEKIQHQDVDFAVIHSNEYQIQKGFYPGIKIAFEFRQPQYLAWAYPADADQDFVRALKQFFRRIQKDGTLERLTERYYGHTQETSQAGALTFYQMTRQRLPRYEALMRRIAAEYGLSWKLLAAISYQESQWDPDASSPTGVRGLMMLTQETATEMGIEDREDAESSLRGGAAYLRKIMDRIPAEVEEPDRSWIALAAYNIGFSHLQDAQFITEFRGYNPNHWTDVKRHLPLLEDRDWYPYTQHGKARGSEPVAYVNKIRNYYNLLTWYEQENKLAPAEKPSASRTASGTPPTAPSASTPPASPQATEAVGPAAPAPAIPTQAPPAPTAPAATPLPPKASPAAG